MTVRRSIATLTSALVLAAAAATCLRRPPAKPRDGDAGAAKPAPQSRRRRRRSRRRSPAAEAGQAGDGQARGAERRAAERRPKLKDDAPATFNVPTSTTSAGVFVVEVTRAWAPKGADRFYNLVKHGYFDGNRFFRVIPNFMVQFGINGDPKLQCRVARGEHRRRSGDAEQQARIHHVRDARARTRGRRRSSSTSSDNAGLDSQGFAPFGQVVVGHGGRRQDQRRVPASSPIRDGFSRRATPI